MFKLFVNPVSVATRICNFKITPLTRQCLAWLILISVVGFQSARVNAALPGGFSSETVASGLYTPIAFDFAPGNRIYVAEKFGHVRVVINGVAERTPFVDISNQVNTYNDRGLVAIAVDPQFPTRPYIYVGYAYDPPEAAGGTGLGGIDGGGSRVSRVSRFTASASSDYKLAEPGSEVVLVGKAGTWSNIINPNQDWRGALTCERNNVPVKDCIPLDEHSHTVGMLKFSADGSLLISVGDASRSGDVTKYPSMRAQRKDFLLGKILRVNPANGLGYNDNPFFDGDPSSNASKVLYYGLRNPFRFTIRKTDNKVFIGNVGWENWEEINTGSPGANFGWPCYEGGSGRLVVHQQHENHPTCQSLYSNSSSVTAPIYGYQKQNGISVSVILGDFAQNTAWPARYRGGLFFADYNRSVVEYLNFDGAGNVSGRNNFGTDMTGVTQMSSGPDRDLYYTAAADGEIRALRYAGGNPAPTASFTASRLTGPAPLLVRFDASGSSDPDNEPLTYRWNFGDNTTSTQVSPNHTFQTDGTFKVRLTVFDSAGGSDTVTREISVGNKAPNLGFGAEAEAKIRSTRYRVGENVVMTGWGNDPEDGTLSDSQLRWTAEIRHNDHSHPDLDSATGTTFFLPFPDHGENTYVEICLTVTDSTGLSAKKCIDAKPRDIRVTVNSEPQGIPIEYAGVTRLTPFDVYSVSGSKRNVTAKMTTADGREFIRWSDGGEIAHTITVPDSRTSIKAIYGPSLADLDSDGDGLSDAAEGQWGTDPHTADPDTDGDGTVDVVDSRPNNPRESGAAVYLTPAVPDTVRRGYRFQGHSDYRSVLRGAFDNSGRDVSVRALGWGIESVNEVSAWMSSEDGQWKWIGNLNTSKNRRENDPSWFFIPQSMMGDGRNLVEFRQRKRGEPWGISQLLLNEIEPSQARRLRPDRIYRTRYGYRFGSARDRYVAAFSFRGKQSDVELRFDAYDIDSQREVMVLLNGQRIAFLSRGGDGRLKQQTIKLRKEKLRTDNLIEFVQLNPPRETWGITNVVLTKVP